MHNIFRDEQTIDGIRYYIKDDADGTLVVADTYDKLFNPISTGKPITDKKWKGYNSDRRNNFIYNQKSY